MRTEAQSYVTPPKFTGKEKWWLNRNFEQTGFSSTWDLGAKKFFHFFKDACCVQIVSKGFFKKIIIQRDI